MEPESTREPGHGARKWSRGQYRQIVEPECGARVWSLKKRAERQMRKKTAEKLLRDCCEIAT